MKSLDEKIEMTILVGGEAQREYVSGNKTYVVRKRCPRTRRAGPPRADGAGKTVGRPG